MWDSETESAGGRDYGNGVPTSSKQGVKTDGFELKDQSWYVATDVPSDLLVQIAGVNFHLHKVPFLILSCFNFTSFCKTPNQKFNIYQESYLNFMTHCLP
uniref:Uncharacterized protein n=1 Tax=Rhizophora mucronata TaxID=61149 RepID=A0A2P2J2Y9_RHIMU